MAAGNPPQGIVGLSEVTGVVLCGGKSLRMGCDKAELELGGRRLIDYPLGVLREVAGRVVLASGAEARFSELGAECVLDPVPDGGPLAGLVAGLAAARAPESRTPWVVVLACDMPRAKSELLRRLLERAARGGLDAALFETRGGVEPLCAVYSTACYSAALLALAAGERRMLSFFGGRDGLRRLAVASFSEADLGLTRSEVEPATNVNTPQDYERERSAHVRTA